MWIVAASLALHSPFGDPLSLEGVRRLHTGVTPGGVPRAATSVGLATLAATSPEAAFAKGGEFGIFEGRIVSLAHPTVMAALYAATLYAGFTGLQWRQLREIGGKVSALKKLQQGLAPEIPEQDGAAAARSPEYAALQSQIDELGATRARSTTRSAA
jgi:hypothetical protein